MSKNIVGKITQVLGAVVHDPIGQIAASARNWARQAGMSKDRVDSAIAKGSGTGASENYDAVRYEGYGPGGIAVIVEALTDNRNRTAADVRSIFTKNSGNMGETGSVGFMFDYVGLIEYPAERILEEAMLEAAIEAGALSLDQLFEEDILGDDLEAWLAETALMKRSAAIDVPGASIVLHPDGSRDRFSTFGASVSSRTARRTRARGCGATGTAARRRRI